VRQARHDHAAEIQILLPTAGGTVRDRRRRHAWHNERYALYCMNREERVKAMLNYDTPHSTEDRERDMTTTTMTTTPTTGRAQNGWMADHHGHT
jgi:hypothetical protein